jgi:hypothetical protein
MMTSSGEEAVTLAGYFSMLATHDWHYEMSDDSGVWRTGNEHQKKLERVAKQSGAHKSLFEAYRKYALEDGPLPERPTERET